MAVSTEMGTVEILDRRRVTLIDAGVAGGNQPYHHARLLDLATAEEYIAAYAAGCERHAAEELLRMEEELRRRQYEVAGLGLVLASGRPLPNLAAILAAHPLVHTAEGELFRGAFRTAGERRGIPVVGIRERDLGLDARIPALGPPWTSDHKAAARAAYHALSGLRGRAPGSELAQ